MADGRILSPRAAAKRGTRKRSGTTTSRRGSPAPRRAGRRSATGSGDLDLDDALALAQTIKGSRQQFAEAFKAAQPPENSVLEFGAFASSIKDNIAAYVRAFVRAAAGGWLEALCLECLNRKIVDGSIINVARRITRGDASSGLQRLVDVELGFFDPDVLANRMPAAVRQVCQVEIDGKAAGSGFLIRADLVMTAHHVVRDLLTPDLQMALPGSAPRLRLRFGYRRTVTGRTITLSEGNTYGVADQWLVRTSPCTNEEYLKRLPEDLERLAGFWDYAIIHLADVPGLGRKGLPMAELPVRRGHRITILQHPRANPMGWAPPSVVRGFLGDGGYRFVHEVNTDEGSSGGPCLNDDLEVVGMHQAGMPDAFPATRRHGVAKSRTHGGATNGRKQNRAVPITRILADWPLENAPPVSSAPARVLTADTARVPEHPVFGRGRMQTWVARSVEDGGTGAIQDRFLTVSGPKGSGKSFSIDLLKAMLPAAEHSVLESRASTFAPIASAVEFANRFLLAPLGADAKSLPSLANANTSDNAWLNYQFIGDLLNMLDKARQERMIWLVLDELDEVGLPDQGQVRKLLDLLYARADLAPWFRILLLGIEAVPVPGMNPFTVQEFLNFSAGDLAADVADYLTRRFKNNSIAVDPEEVRRQALNEVQRALSQLGDAFSHPDLLRTVAEAIVRLELATSLRRG